MLVKHQTSSGYSNEDREEAITEEARTITEQDEEETKEHESTLPLKRKGKTVIFDDEKSMISSRLLSGLKK